MNRPPQARSRLAFRDLPLPALAWASTLLYCLGFAVAPGPGSARNWLVLVVLVAAVGAAHAAVLELAAAAARRAGGRVGLLLDLAVALLFGALYAFLVLSLAKFVKTHAFLNEVDLGFLRPSWSQLVGEGTRTERRALWAALLLPLGLGFAFFALLRWMRRKESPSRAVSLRRAVVLLLGGAGSLATLVALDPAARWAATTLLPEAAAVRLARAVVAGASDPRPPTVAVVPLPAWNPAPPATRTNLVLVMLESVPWKRVFGPEARPESTPTLARLARESVVFSHAYAASTHSDYAQTAILASLHPRRFDRHDFFRDLSYPRALPWDVLGPAGWRSGLFSTQNEKWGNMLAFVQTPALGTLRHARDFPDAPHRGEGAETKIFEETALDAFAGWLDDASSEATSAIEPPVATPFVAVLNFQATHFPYVWPESFTPPYGEAPLDFDATFLGYPRERIPRLLDRFHNALAASDRALARLLDELARRDLLDSTVIAVVADHGEAFYEHGVPAHGTTLHDEQVRVPMLIRFPPSLAGTIGAPRVVDEPVSTLDLLPTVYRALGLPHHGALQGRDDTLEPSYTAAGRPLFFTIQGMTNEDGILLDGWKVIVNRDRRQAALYRVELDPDERSDRFGDDPERAAALLVRLDSWIAGQLAYYGERRWERGLEPPPVP